MKKLIIFGLVFLLFIYYVNGIYVEKTVLDYNFLGANFVVSSDIDGDGDQDIIASASSDSIKTVWYENNGDGGFTQHTISSSIAANTLIVQDLDDDFDMDVLISSGIQNILVWFENDGSESFTQNTISSSFDFDDAYIIDLDDDGDQDIISTTQQNNSIMWWQNDGFESFTQHNINTSFGTSSNQIFGVDLDGDSDQDIVASSKSNNDLVWFENDGSESFTQHLINGSEAIKDISVVDLDGDSDQDIITTTSTNNLISWYENDGSESFTHNSVYSVSGPRTIKSFDYDSDSDIDLLGVSFNSDQVILYENDGSESFTNIIIDNSLNGATGSDYSDFDNDGDYDFVAVGAFANDLVWYENYYGTPIIRNSRIAPTFVDTITNLSGYCNASIDPISNLTYYYKWWNGSNLYLEGNDGGNNLENIETNVNNLSSTYTDTGEIWTFSCLASDGTSNSTWLNSSEITIQEKPITINSYDSSLCNYNSCNLSINVSTNILNEHTSTQWKVLLPNNSITYLNGLDSTNFTPSLNGIYNFTITAISNLTNNDSVSFIKQLYNSNLTTDQTYYVTNGSTYNFTFDLTDIDGYNVTSLFFDMYMNNLDLKITNTILSSDEDNYYGNWTSDIYGNDNNYTTHTDPYFLSDYALQNFSIPDNFSSGNLTFSSTDYSSSFLYWWIYCYADSSWFKLTLSSSNGFNHTLLTPYTCYNNNKIQFKFSPIDEIIGGGTPTKVNGEFYETSFSYNYYSSINNSFLVAIDTLINNSFEYNNTNTSKYQDFVNISDSSLYRYINQNSINNKISIPIQFKFYNDGEFKLSDYIVYKYDNTSPSVSSNSVSSNTAYTDQSITFSTIAEDNQTGINYCLLNLYKSDEVTVSSNYTFISNISSTYYRDLTMSLFAPGTLEWRNTYCYDNEGNMKTYSDVNINITLSNRPTVVGSATGGGGSRETTVVINNTFLGCGDGICQNGENNQICPKDCKPLSLGGIDFSEQKFLTYSIIAFIIVMVFVFDIIGYSKGSLILFGNKIKLLRGTKR